MAKLTKRNYVDRDVSWMYFNHRILEEAQREEIPVLERMSFLGIYSNNLDEFFRVRMANLKAHSQLSQGEMIESPKELMKKKSIQEELHRIVDYGLMDTMQGRVVIGNQDNDLRFRSQEELYKHYSKI